MAAPTFNPGVNPSYDYQKETNYRILSAKFGDGYEQTAGDGLNATYIIAKLNFNAIDTSVANAIEAFMNERQGSKPFMYTLPDESTPRQFKSSEKVPKTSAGSPNSWNIQLELKETFDIV